MNSTIKDIGNTLYQGGLLAAGVVGSRYLSKSLGLKDRPIEFKLKNLGMLALEVAAANYVVQKLQDSAVIPKNIFI